MSPMPKPSDAARAKADQPEATCAGIGRRDLMGAAGFLLGGAGAVAGVGQAGALNSSPSAGSPEGGDGLTDHRRTYYRLARF